MIDKMKYVTREVAINLLNELNKNNKLNDKKDDELNELLIQYKLIIHKKISKNDIKKLLKFISSEFASQCTQEQIKQLYCNMINKNEKIFEISTYEIENILKNKKGIAQ